MIPAPREVRELAAAHGWRLDIDKPTYLLFTKDLAHKDARLRDPRDVCEVNLRLGLVKTTLNHPRKGRGTLTRRIVSLARLRAVFKDPRVHYEGGFFPANPHGQLGAEWLTL